MSKVNELTERRDFWTEEPRFDQRQAVWSYGLAAGALALAASGAAAIIFGEPVVGIPVFAVGTAGALCYKQEASEEMESSLAMQSTATRRQVQLERLNAETQ